jgi:hypothetical protein
MFHALSLSSVSRLAALGALREVANALPKKSVQRKTNLDSPRLRRLERGTEIGQVRIITDWFAASFSRS